MFSCQQFTFLADFARRLAQFVLLIATNCRSVEQCETGIGIAPPANKLSIALLVVPLRSINKSSEQPDFTKNPHLFL